VKIYSMTATFGKLEHEVLTLKPGLNIIEAPNEWGKSTWCAFLVTMLYGLDTRAKTTKAALADKERFAPWSGAPMSGRIDLNWNGRDITIERSSKGRTPMGVFRAFETATGIEVTELTASNCGQQLLGVERSVFTRSAFLRFSDLPVTQDDALRHRLNALVTTGDESGAAEALGQKLRDLKNHCRYNRSGLLPQAEADRDALEKSITERDALAERAARLQQRQQALTEQIAQLENHKAALRYAAAREDAQRVETAEAACDQAQRRCQHLQTLCGELPDQQQARQAVERLDALHQDMAALQAREQMLPPVPGVPATPACFAGVRPEDAPAQAQRDAAALTELQAPQKPKLTGLILLGVAIAVAAILVALLISPLVGACLLLGELAVLMLVANKNSQHNKQLAECENKKAAITMRYGGMEPSQWVAAAYSYAAEWDSYNRSLELLRQQREELDISRNAVNRQMRELSGRTRGQWQEIIAMWEDLTQARNTAAQAQQHLQTLRSVVKTVAAPALPDTLTYPEEETNRLLIRAMQEQKHLEHELGQCSGQLERLGNAATLTKELEKVQRRIHALEQTNDALEQALTTLTAARQELQRRFAPRITHRAQELFGKLTGDRYDRYVLAEDLSVQAGARGEDVLHSQQWRSDGTVDQLYLALRLAVAGELIPDAPLVLDDALVRFDDERLKAALQILSREAQDKQVILFTCQSREKDLLEG
jgi:uncharacterized protein YhaN